MLQFSTNVNCGNCLAKVKPFLDEKIGAGKWKVDITDPRKILTVENNAVSVNEVIEAVQKPGFKASLLAS